MLKSPSPENRTDLIMHQKLMIKAHEPIYIEGQEELVQESPERSLCAAILLSAVHDLTVKDRHHFKRAFIWFCGATSPITFADCCQVLALDPDIVLGRLISLQLFPLKENRSPGLKFLPPRRIARGNSPKLRAGMPEAVKARN